MNQIHNKLFRPTLCLVILLAIVSVFFFTPVSAAGEGTVDPGKDGNLVIAYSTIAVLSFLLLAGYILLEKKREAMFVGLYSCVFLVNCGYFLQAVSRTLTGAMMANRLSYFGAAYSVLVMLLIIMDACQIRRRKWLIALLTGITTAAFLLAASGDWLGLYYKAVTIETVNGMTRLVKDYGPLHTV
jgi:hypothetical protein